VVQTDARASEHDDVAHELQALQVKHRDLIDKEHKATSECDSLKTRLEYQQRDLDAAAQEVAEATRQHHLAARRLKEALGKEAGESKVLVEQLQKLLHQQEHDAKTIINTLKAVCDFSSRKAAVLLSFQNTCVFFLQNTCPGQDEVQKTLCQAGRPDFCTAT
jgi:hypothetical protein